jgi:hypothetical protein
MFIGPELLFENELRRSGMFISLLAELWELGRLGSINVALLTELQTCIAFSCPVKLRLESAP